MNAHRLLTFVCFIALASTCLLSCQSKGGGESIKPFVDPSFGAYVSSYTAGTISSTSPITIRLVKEVSDDIFNTVQASELLSISPSVDGEVLWIDKQTIEFKPVTHLSSGSSYKVRFNLSKLESVPKQMSFFEYTLRTVNQNFDLSINNLTTPVESDLSLQSLTGSIITADVAENLEVEPMLVAMQGETKLAIEWEHSSDKLEHRFTLSGIKRVESEGEISLRIDGSPIGSDKSDELILPIPAIGDFKLVTSYVEQSGEQHIVLRFSDPISPTQNLNGIVRIGNLRNLSFDIKGNEILVYPSVRQTGTKRLLVSEGIRNILGYKLKDGIETDIAFEQIKPQIKFTGNGNIVPGTDGIILPFDAVGLKAVEVSIIKIFESNIPQFLQINTVAGGSEMRRVGKPVFRRVIRLDEGLTELAKWNRFTLDLSEYIKTDPGALYQVKIGFRQQHSMYFCGDNAEVQEDLFPLEDESWDGPAESTQSSYWDGYEDYYYADDYNWSERDNPCSSSYYGDRHSIRRNVLSSNVGLIGKMGAVNEVVAAVTDIRTALPLSNIGIQVLDFQHRIVGEGVSDAQGFARIKVTGTPFLLIADDGVQKGYLKMDDGSSLSLSSFDVRGSIVQKGIKGFLYGERGVWRPGDSLHLSFVLEDKENLIPEDHPVVFELTDPMGKLTKRIVSTFSENNFYRFSSKTDDDAQTGNWNATVKVGGTSFNKRLKIETVKPNRLKINLDFNRDKITSRNKQLNGDLNVTWLHGAPARNLKAEFDVLLTKGQTKFDGYEDYSFENPERGYYSDTYSIFSGQLDNDGNANINSSLYANNNPPGVLNATFLGKVYEEGGNFSIKNFTIPYYPFTSFVGIKTPRGDKARGMLLTDTLHTVTIATLDDEGEKVSREVAIKLYKVDWRWWWDNTEYGANYVSGSYSKVIKEGVVSTSNGKGEWNFEIKYPDWGRYFLRACDTSSGHCTGKIIYVDWPGWAGRAERDNPGGASMLSFSTDKKSYTVGERVRVDIPGSGEGRALVSLESGKKVLDTYWVDTKLGENQFFFETTPEMAPGIYVNVTMIQKHSQSINDLPIRMYGVTPIEVTDPESKLEPRIEMANTLAPGEPVSIKISEATGKKMTYTVAVVDEGLLDLTNYTTPNPWNTFYAREALGVRTWDVFEYVMGAYGGRLERLLAIGGDGEEESSEKKSKANRFKAVVKYMGPFTLEEGDSRTHSFIMPQYVGSVKTMVIAGNAGAYGMTDKATPVKKPVMILGTVPRVLGPDEVFTLPVSVFAMENSIRNVKVEIKTNGLLQLQSSATRNVAFREVGDKLVNFDLKVASELGVGTIDIVASSGSNTAKYSVEVQVRNPNPPITLYSDALIEANKEWKSNYTAPGLKGTNSGYLEISNIPPVDLSRRLNQLIRYPYGCIEQTTSSLFPQLFLAEVMDISSEKKVEIENNIKSGISRIRRFQVSSGGFSYWPGEGEAHEWGTNYAGHFLIEAREKGYNVPSSLIRNWRKYQSKAASKWRRGPKNRLSDLNQAYRLYTLALEGSPETGAMNRLRESENLSLQAAWRLAAAYAITGQNEAAKEMISDLREVVSAYSELDNTFGSKLRDEAMILETLGLMGEYTRGASILKDIANQLSKNNWISTQATAYSLIAVSKFVTGSMGDKTLKFTYAVNGKSVDATTELPLIQVPIDMGSNPTGTVAVTNTSGGLIYARMVATGSPSRGSEKSSENGLKMSVRYSSTEGRTIDVSSLAQGTDFIAEVTVQHAGILNEYKNLALTQIFPSGWEIINNRLSDTENILSNSIFDYQDIRDDRVYTFFDLKRNEKKTFRIRLNSSYAGSYYLPSILCEAMYDQTIRSVIAGKNADVVTQGVQ